jgi:LysR family nitrogen assimilation transcriptional regulator
MKLQQIRTFVVVYQERSVTAAAERLNATQSGLSMQLKELEGYLGVQLFERSTRGVVPTVAGDRFYPHALSLVGSIRNAREEVMSLIGHTLGSVRCGVIPTISRAVLSRALCTFTDRYPNVKLHVVEAYSAPLTESVARESLDFAIVPANRNDARVKAEPIAIDRELFATSCASGRPNLSPVRIRDIGPLNLIVPSEGNVRRARLDDYLARTGAEVAKVLEMDAMMATLELVAVSNWTAILPAALCYSDLDGSVRRVHPLVDPSLSVEYALITPAARPLSAGAHALSSVIIERIKEVAGECEQRFSL